MMLERSTVLFRDPSNKGRRFIPLLLGNCDLPDTLQRYKYIDFREESEAAFAEMLATCRPETESVPSAPEAKLKKRPAKKKPKQVKPTQATEPLFVLERKLSGHKDWVQSVAVSPDGSWLASGSNDKTIKVWDLKTGECRATLEGHKDKVRSVAITPDGKRILSGSDDNTIRVWDSANGQQLASWKASSHFVSSIAIMSDNQRVISCGVSEDLEIWDIAAQKSLVTLTGHSDYVICVAVTSNDKQAVSVGEDQKVLYWNLESGECLERWARPRWRID